MAELLVVWMSDGSVDIPVCPGARPGALSGASRGLMLPAQVPS